MLASDDVFLILLNAGIYVQLLGTADFPSPLPPRNSGVYDRVVGLCNRQVSDAGYACLFKVRNCHPNMQRTANLRRVCACNQIYLSSCLQSDLAIADLVITETLLHRTLFKALPSQSHLAITDKLKFWWSRYNGNLFSTSIIAKSDCIYPPEWTMTAAGGERMLWPSDNPSQSPVVMVGPLFHLAYPVLRQG